MAFRAPKSTEVFVSPIINFKANGLTTIFTTDSAGIFVPQILTFVCTAATAPNDDSAVNIGWTAINYDDYLNGAPFGLLAANTFIETLAESSPFPTIPASTIVRANVVTPDSGTALMGRIIFSGYYV